MAPSETENIRQRHTGKKKEETISRRLGDLREEEATIKASRGWISHFLLALVLTPIFCVAILLVLPSEIEPVEMTPLSSPPAFEGPLTPNDLLSKGEKIFTGKVIGPESLVVDGDHIYTGTMDGWVNHLHKGEVRKLVKFGKEPCETESDCGRPLGMRMDKNGFLIVADAYYGLFQVNVATGDSVPLYHATTPVNGKISKFLNDLDIGPDGKIYFTDSSTKWHREKFHKVFLEGRDNGRLLMYNPETRTTEQLFGDMIFANGVQITSDKSAVLVAECALARIWRYDLKTKKRSIWVENLPGFPDNIRYDKLTGTYWVGLAGVREANQFSFFDFALARPWLRNILAKIPSSQTFMALKEAFDRSRISAIAVELDSTGSIKSSMQGKKGFFMSAVSEIASTNHAFYLGSFKADFLVRLYKKKLESN